jgi:hypothetical protein
MVKREGHRDGFGRLYCWAFVVFFLLFLGTGLDWTGLFLMSKYLPVLTHLFFSFAVSSFAFVPFFVHLRGSLFALFCSVLWLSGWLHYTIGTVHLFFFSFSFSSPFFFLRIGSVRRIYLICGLTSKKMQVFLE